MSEPAESKAAAEEAKTDETPAEDETKKDEDTPADPPKDDENKDEDADEEMKDGEEEEGGDDDAKTEGKKKRKKSSPVAAEPVKRERRERKTVGAFTPDDFKHEDKKSVQQKTGRGVPLGELAEVAESIDKVPQSDETLFALHRLVFHMRGKPARKELKANLMKFSGYLPPKDDSLDKKAQDELDEEHEVKMGAKAYKLAIPQIKAILDLLKVDRTKKVSKDDLVDLLLDFLGEPKKKFVKGGGTKSKKPAAAAKKSGKKKKTKKAAKKESDDGEEEEDEEEEEEEEEEAADDADEEEKPAAAVPNDDYSDIGDEKIEDEGGVPSDDVLRRWVRAYVRCHNMKKSTIKTALDLASDKFGVDLTEKKQRLKELLTEEM